MTFFMAVPLVVCLLPCVTSQPQLWSRQQHMVVGWRTDTDRNIYRETAIDRYRQIHGDRYRQIQADTRYRETDIDRYRQIQEDRYRQQ